MADNSPGLVTSIGDSLGVPGMAGGLYWLAKRAPWLTRTLLTAPRVLAGGPVTAAMTAAQVMQPVPANGGEQPIYVKDPITGQLKLNTQNPIVGNRTSLAPSPVPQPTVNPAPIASPPPAPMPVQPMQMPTTQSGNIPLPPQRPVPMPPQRPAISPMPQPRPVPQAQPYGFVDSPAYMGQGSTMGNGILASLFKKTPQPISPNNLLFDNGQKDNQNIIQALLSRFG